MATRPLSNRSKSNRDLLSYPTNLEQEVSQMAAFISYEYKFNEINSLVRSKNKRRQVVQNESIMRDAIYLPMPTALNLSSQQDFQNQELGIIGTSIAKSGLTSNLLDAPGSQSFTDLGSTALETIFDGLGILKKNFSDKGAQLNFLLNNLQSGAAGDKLIGSFRTKQGLSRNPHLALLYEGTQFRNHSFAYKFVAKDRNEWNNIKKIINRFQYYMHPEFRLSTHFFKYPNFFLIKFLTFTQDSGDELFENNNLFETKPCALTNFSVNYHAQGLPVYHFDGEPVDVEIALEFTEMGIWTREDYTLDADEEERNRVNISF